MPVVTCAIWSTPRPKAGVFAVRAGPPLYNEFAESVAGSHP